MEWIKAYLRGNTERGKYDSGAAMHKMGAVSGAYAKEQGREVLFYGNVTDEYRRQTYSALVRVDRLGHRLLEASCDCQSLLNGPTNFGICPHTVAIALKGIELLKQKDVPDEEKIIITPAIEVSLTALKKGGFGMNFTIEGIEKTEYRKIFTAYKEKKKRLYLGDERYLNLFG